VELKEIDTSHNNSNTHPIPSEISGIDSFLQGSEKNSRPTIAGILLVIGGTSALLFWLSLAFLMDVTMIESMVNLSQFQEVNPDITPSQIREVFTICGTIFVVLSVFPIVGGILALKRKMWGIAVVGGILGLFTVGFLFLSSILSLIGLILVIISKKEFLLGEQQKDAI
jgi:hypothetical protein